jgi:hypothetical protein
VNETDNSVSASQRADAVNEVSDVAAEYARATLDALHVEDLLGHIPVVRTSLAAAKAIGSLRDHLLLKKVGIFLYGIASIPSADRRNMVRQLSTDPDFGENLGEHLIELLDRLDGRRKPAMVGAVFTAFAFAQIDAKTLRRLNTAIQNLSIIDVPCLRALQAASRPEESPDGIAMQALANAGLAAPEFTASGIRYQVNEVGRMFLELELDHIQPSDV